MKTNSFNLQKKSRHHRDQRSSSVINVQGRLFWWSPAASAWLSSRRPLPQSGPVSGDQLPSTWNQSQSLVSSTKSKVNTCDYYQSSTFFFSFYNLFWNKRNTNEALWASYQRHEDHHVSLDDMTIRGLLSSFWTDLQTYLCIAQLAHLYQVHLYIAV